MSKASVGESSQSLLSHFKEPGTRKMIVFPLLCKVRKTPGLI